MSQVRQARRAMVIRHRMFVKQQSAASIGGIGKHGRSFRNGGDNSAVVERAFIKSASSIRSRQSRKADTASLAGVDAKLFLLVKVVKCFIVFDNSPINDRVARREEYLQRRERFPTRVRLGDSASCRQPASANKDDQNTRTLYAFLFRTGRPRVSGHETVTHEENLSYTNKARGEKSSDQAFCLKRLRDLVQQVREASFVSVYAAGVWPSGKFVGSSRVSSWDRRFMRFTNLRL